MNEETLTLYPSKIKNTLLILISIIFTILGVWMIQVGEIRGWFAVIFFGLGNIVLIINLFPNSSYLRLSDQGFEMRSLFRSTFTHWDAIEQFELGVIRHKKMVVFNYTPNHFQLPTGVNTARKLTGFDGALPDTYGKSIEELSSLLNEWKYKFSKK